MNNIIQPRIIDVTITLHPNPATDCFRVNGLIEPSTIIISDLHCRVHLKKEIINEENICLKKLPKGVYIAKITTVNGIVEKKLVKK